MENGKIKTMIFQDTIFVNLQGAPPPKWHCLIFHMNFEKIKNDPIGVILCGESIARIPEA
jgi:hypothetical protein